MYTRCAKASDMKYHIGKTVELTGRISHTPWQHLMGNPFGFGETYYFDVGDFQIVIYSKVPIDCAGEVKIRGTVLKIQGPPKSAGSKVDETYVEYHLAVDEWTCRE
jgi:hypothetical protein